MNPEPIHPEMAAVTYTHPECPSVALRAEDLGDGVWRRTLLANGAIAHTTDRPETIPGRHTHQIQASQTGFVLTGTMTAVGPDAGHAAQARAAVGEHQDEIDDLASHIAQGRATATHDTDERPPTR